MLKSRAVSERVARRKAIKAARRRRATIGNEFGELLVFRKRRAVRITAITKQPAGWNGKSSGAAYAFVDLDDADVDRLVARLVAIRGGQRAIPRSGRR